MNIKIDKILKSKEAAELAGVPAYKLRCDAIRGIVPFVRPKYPMSHRRFLESDILKYKKWLEEQNKGH